MTIAVFVLSLAVSLGAYFLLSRRSERKERTAAIHRLNRRERAKRKENRPAAGPLLMRMAGEVRGRMAMRLLECLNLKKTAELWLETAGLNWGAAGLIHRSAALLIAGFLLVTLILRRVEPLWAFSGGALLAVLPFLYVRRQVARRVRHFEEQFPDCLEFISRSMRAGHAFSVSLEMVYREFSEPLAGEFRRTFEEQNLGQPLEIVLKKLGRRVPSIDVQFFVSAVLLQKRTGGNLAELLDKLAHIIRERFKLRARIRTISAQGVMSGRILAAIPASIGLMMLVVNRGYAQFFVDDPMGQQLLAGALALQLIGFLIIRKIVTIEV
jgi:tight adherence protein B